MSAIGAALESVRERIAAACERAGRDAGEVRLVAVSKSMPAPKVAELVAAGHTLLGENRVQEALDKIPQVGPPAVWHFVGHLQRNKARHVVGVFELIHSVDNLKLAQELDRRADAVGVRQPILLQANLSRETSKHGVEEQGLLALAASVAALEHLELRGLMTIPPPVDSPEASRIWFRRLARLAERAGQALGRPLPELSMGMTGDFEVAVEEGATLVRVGRAIFGER